LFVCGIKGTHRGKPTITNICRKSAEIASVTDNPQNFRMRKSVASHAK
jgi:hypothetical protein